MDFTFASDILCLGAKSPALAPASSSHSRAKRQYQVSMAADVKKVAERVNAILIARSNLDRWSSCKLVLRAPSYVDRFAGECLMLGAPHYKLFGRAAVIYLDNPPVNAITAVARARLKTLIERFATSKGIDAIILTGAGPEFSSGTDISRSSGKVDFSGLPELITTIKASAVPIVAALEGRAIGEALSIALACHARVATPSVQLAFPEATWGLVPSGAAALHLSELAGLQYALEMIVGGKNISGNAAHALGVVDELVSSREALVDEAIRVGTDRSPRRSKSPTEKGQQDIIKDFKQSFPASLKAPAGKLAMECVLGAQSASLEENIAIENRHNEKLLAEAETIALLHASNVELATDLPHFRSGSDTISLPKCVAVVGFGFMGRGIAISFATGGVKVLVHDQAGDRVAEGLEAVGASLKSMVRRGRISQEQAETARNNIIAIGDMEALDEADLVVEAVSEDLELKKRIFAKLDSICPNHATLVTNTSSLDIDEIAAATGRPKNIAGMHFFSPAHLLKLVEIVPGRETAEETIEQLRVVSKHIGKIGVVVGNQFAFVANKLLAGYQREALFLLEEGALPEQVDRVLQEFGFAMGPFVMNDMAGNDISYHVRQAASYPAGMRYPHVADRIYEAGRYGQKTNKGWYRYEPGQREAHPDIEVAALIESTSSELGFKRRNISDDEILQRCLLPVVNDAAWLLGDGIARSSGDIDVVWMNGLGFPRRKGGPMFWADHLGPKRVYERVIEFREEHGPVLWEPAPLLAFLAKSGMRFADVR
ncbi:3-hydroxyacyl-CoA dehydrogenase NAD-binding domain-containing protein [Mesorhizobium sp.]|uniref:3-hydroxyacyl-CoA dehydrogenase NAD-binding domain-containing protein n=1 Tax=Mesorhizobium sp. TaxID=1871066 RepID=UPI00257AB5F2|nr:3-hydroxyacyl-CoA dehydrogenase NAD-binding domain-containing protein [Mesorhizobium sp.]